MKLVVSDFVNLGSKTFNFISCRICTEKIIPTIVHDKRGNLPQNAKIVNLINAWDKLDISPSFLDIAGCLIPHESNIHAGPNGRRFIIRPCEHNTIHGAKLRQSNKSSSHLQVNKPVKNSSISMQHSTTPESRSIIIKHQKKLKMVDISTMMDPKI